MSAVPVPAVREPAGEEIAGNLARIAATLTQIAASVSAQAQAAMLVTREAADQARQTAALASELVTLGTTVGAHLDEQHERTRQARAAASEGAEAMDALLTGASDIENLVGLIGHIATESRLLALNARIEAARAGEAGRGFDVVAHAMSALSQQTFETTRNADERARAMLGKLDGAHRLFATGRDQADAAREGLGEVLPAARRQSDAASQVLGLADDTLERVEASATAIGRVNSAATTVRLLAQQIEAAAQQLRG